MISPVYANQDWEFRMENVYVSGKDNGKTYNLNAGTRTVTGSVYTYSTNNNNPAYTASASLYRVRAWQSDVRVEQQSLNMPVNGGSTSVNISKSNQPEGEYYLVFSRSNRTGIMLGHGSIR